MEVASTLKMASAQVVETSVANNSPSQDSNYPDDLFNQGTFILTASLARVSDSISPIGLIASSTRSQFPLILAKQRSYLCLFSYTIDIN